MWLRLTCLLLVVIAPPAADAEQDCSDLFQPNLPSAGDLQGEMDRTIGGFLSTSHHTPGLVYAVVRDDLVLHVQGFGVSSLATCEPVTENTGFYLLSTTKTLTGLLAAQAHEAGEVQLDAAVTEHLGEMSMPEPINADQVTLRRLLLHSPGFFNGAINYRTYVPGNAHGDELVRLMSQHSQPTPPTFAYSNIGYILGGLVLERAVGKPWQAQMREQVFQPLGITRTTTDIDEARADRFALPYAINDSGGFTPAPVKVQAQMHAAGGVVSTAGDLARLLRVFLSDGQLVGEQVVPSRVVRQALAPQVALQRRFYRFDRYAYGLGLYHADFEGEWLVHHFGGPIHFSFMPDHGIGVVVLTAGPDSTRLSHMIGAYLYDTLLERERNYEAELARVIDGVKKSRQRLFEANAGLRAESTLDEAIRPLRLYEGHYFSDRLGLLKVKAVEDGLSLTYGVHQTALEPHQPDQFLVQMVPRNPLAVFEFRFDEPDQPATLLDWGGREFVRSE